MTQLADGVGLALDGVEGESDRVLDLIVGFQFSLIGVFSYTYIY